MEQTNTEFEQNVHDDLVGYLLSQGEIDAHFPEAPDLEAKWPALAQEYMVDGIREFADYPIVSLGWMMYLGMALATLWDSDWPRYGACQTLYADMRGVRGYDALDEYIREDILCLKGDAFAALERLVGECAQRTHSLLRRSGHEPGTPAAFHAYVACLHQLYLAGVAVQLHRMGYHMTKIQ